MFLFLLILAAAGIWAIRAWFWPYTRCGRCDGTGRNRGSGTRRFGLCKKCGGSGRRQVRGSRMIHRFARSARASWRGKDS
jgi:hypothetical protein